MRLDESEALLEQRVSDATAPAATTTMLVHGDDLNGLDGVRLRRPFGNGKHLDVNGHGYLSPGRREGPSAARRGDWTGQPPPSPARRGQPGSAGSQPEAEETPATPQQTGHSANAVHDVPETLLSVAKTAEGQRGVGGRHHDKVFVVRNSALTDLLATTNMRTLYHIAVVVLLVLLLRTVPQDLAKHGTVTLGLGMVCYAFGSFHLVLGISMGITLAAIALHAAFVHWARRRLHLSAVARHWWDVAHLAALVLFDVAILALPALGVSFFALPFLSCTSVFFEAWRVLMKTHSFVRSNAPRALEQGTSPTLAQFIYFLFAPTLIYRDSYPRNPKVRWRLVGHSVLEILGCVLFVALLSERYALPPFRDFGLRPGAVSPLDLAADVVGTALPAALIFVLTFYLLLHALQNAFAEALRFGDRMFYSDWWNQDNFPSYYLKWNVLVQDWLHKFVYRDIILFGGSRLTAKLTVFTISAIAHEFVLCFSMGFFYPVLYLHFGVIGMLLSFVTVKNSSSSIGNLLVWLAIILGCGFLFGLYSIEYYARLNCPKTIDSMWDRVIPRSWSCIPKESS